MKIAAKIFSEGQLHTPHQKPLYDRRKIEGLSLLNLERLDGKKGPKKNSPKSRIRLGTNEQTPHAKVEGALTLSNKSCQITSLSKIEENCITAN